MNDGWLGKRKHRSGHSGGDADPARTIAVTKRSHACCNTLICNINLLILLLGDISIIDTINIGLLDSIDLIIRIYWGMSNEEVGGLVSQLKNGRKIVFRKKIVF